jgi:serine O-acetyltransferase
MSHQEVVARTVEALCRPESYDAVYHRPTHDGRMPSVADLYQIVEGLRAVIFPGFFGEEAMTPEAMPYVMGSTLLRVQSLLVEQIRRGYCFACAQDGRDCKDCEERSLAQAEQFIAGLPEIRRLLATDVAAAYEGDPAAKSPQEAIFSYPSIRALTDYRVAHQLHVLGVELIPRIITEMAHSATGIDIHPGTSIGERFFIDHGTGTVIGETSIIGNNVRLYQGVTLGAKSFLVDESGALVKGIPRHPIVEDDVIIYAGATILGRVRIGRGSIIGANVWLIHDVDPGSIVLQSEHARPVIALNGEDRDTRAQVTGRVRSEVGPAG